MDSVEDRASTCPRGLCTLSAIVVFTALAAGIGGVASARAPEFYQALVKPSWAPPAWVFGPVWTLLYLLMALAAWMVVRARGWRAARLPLVLYGLQLLVNALWTWLFFAWRSGSAAVLDIAVLWILAAATLWAFWRVRPLAGALLVPYLAWVSFASALSWAVWRLNPGVL